MSVRLSFVCLAILLHGVVGDLMYEWTTSEGTARWLRFPIATASFSGASVFNITGAVPLGAIPEHMCSLSRLPASLAGYVILIKSGCCHAEVDPLRRPDCAWAEKAANAYVTSMAVDSPPAAIVIGNCDPSAEFRGPVRMNAAPGWASVGMVPVVSVGCDAYEIIRGHSYANHPSQTLSLNDFRASGDPDPDPAREYQDSGARARMDRFFQAVFWGFVAVCAMYACVGLVNYFRPDRPHYGGESAAAAVDAVPTVHIHTVPTNNSTAPTVVLSQQSAIPTNNSTAPIVILSECSKNREEDGAAIEYSESRSQVHITPPPVIVKPIVEPIVEPIVKPIVKPDVAPANILVEMSLDPDARAPSPNSQNSLLPH